MSTKTCPKCGNLQAYGDFCSQCGQDLRGVRASEDLVATSVQHREEYQTLRFVSSIMVVMGWLVVLVSVLFACIAYGGAADAIVTQSGAESILGRIGSVAGLLAVTAASGIGVLVGVGSIAGGQIILVILDIRDDIHQIATE